MIVQKINSKVEDAYERAYKYFSILSTLNNLDLVKRDLQLIAYAISQNKDVSEVKEEFVEKFGTSMATIGNIISKLYKRNILKKDRRVVSINPALLFNFEEDLALGITLVNNGDKG